MYLADNKELAIHGKYKDPSYCMDGVGVVLL